jgi:hypothetical protein
MGKEERLGHMLATPQEYSKPNQTVERTDKKNDLLSFLYFKEKEEGGTYSLKQTQDTLTTCSS